MSHLPTLIADLALILISASVITLLFKWMKQPLVLGYIIAGLLAGPYINIFPTVGDIENINIWAEIGVIFLIVRQKRAKGHGCSALCFCESVGSQLFIILFSSTKRGKQYNR